MCLLLCLLQSFLRLLLLRQRSTDGTRLLHSQILANVLGTSACLTNALLLLLVVHSQDACNGLSHLLDFGNFGGSTAGNLGHMKFGKLFTVLSEGFEEFFLGKSSKFVCLDHDYYLLEELVGAAIENEWEGCNTNTEYGLETYFAVKNKTTHNHFEQHDAKV
jgi:hypothetical protein